MIVTRRGNISFVSQSAISWLKEIGLTRGAFLERFLSAGQAAPFCLGADGRRLWVTEAGRNRKGSICLILETLPAPLHSLTPREREAHHWVCFGKSNEEIAAQMGIRVCTVRKHLQNLFEKLGVENRTAAASYGDLLSLAALPD